MADDKSFFLNYKFKPRDWQKHCLANMKRFTVCAMHRRAGKTILAINLLILKALNTPNGNFCYVCPELKQAKRIAWKPLKQICEQFKNYTDEEGNEYEVVEIRESELIVRFANKAEIQLYGADNPDNIRGSKFNGAVLDEVAQMPPDLWDEIVYPALMDTKGFALFIGTPKGINLFSELFERGKGRDPRYKENWISFKFTCYETQALPPEEIEAYKVSVSEEKFKREMLCDFSASATDQLLSLQQCIDASERSIEENLLAHTPVVVGVDVARYGDDKSVIMVRQGLLVRDFYRIGNIDLVSLSTWVMKYVTEYNAKYLFVDGTGVGGGLVDILTRRLAGDIQLFDINFGHKAFDPKFGNKRTEMWFAMADWIKKGGIIPKNDDLISELAMPTYEVKDGNKIMLESKKAIRDRMKKSPDIADALALTFGENVSIFAEDDNYLEDELKRLKAMRAQQGNDPFSRFERECMRNDYF